MQRFVLTLPSGLPVQLRVTLARDYLAGLVRANRRLLAARLVPPLYSTPVLYRPEPDADMEEEYADALTCYRRGWGDCDDLAAWRVAELQNEGVDAELLFRAYPVRAGERRLVHCLVRLPERWPGAPTEEDPSRRQQIAEESRRKR